MTDSYAYIVVQCTEYDLYVDEDFRLSPKRGLCKELQTCS